MTTNTAYMQAISQCSIL